MKIKNYVLILFVLVLGFNSCNSDDDIVDVIIGSTRDRAEQYVEDSTAITEYLKSHFFNYEEFEMDPMSSTFEVVLDTIPDTGMNSDKIPLFDQLGGYLKSKTVNDSEGVEYSLFYLKVREGGGDQPKFADSTLMTYKGTMINDDLIFDSKITPEWLQLHYTVQGFRETMLEFKGSPNDVIIDPDDGTSSFTDFGIGAMFIPSGLAYFSAPPSGSGISTYTPLIFTFQMLDANDSDDDNDGIFNIYEDLEEDSDLEVDRDGDGDPTNDYGDGNVFNDNTDGDTLPNFLDSDDDNDGILTKYEDLEPDSDLEVDRDLDGDFTNDFGDGDPTNDDDDNDGIPNYLDTDSITSNQDL